MVIGQVLFDNLMAKLGLSSFSSVKGHHTPVQILNLFNNDILLIDSRIRH